MKKPTKIIITTIVAAAIFYSGFSYGQSVASSGASTSAYGGARVTRTGATAGAGFAGGSAAVGTVVSSDSSSVTVALKSGGSVVAFYSTSTPITDTTVGTQGDLSEGANVTVLGTANSDGSITANSIQIRQATPTTGQ